MTRLRTDRSASSSAQSDYGGVGQSPCANELSANKSATAASAVVAEKIKLSIRAKIGYGAAGFAASMFYNNFSFFALFFFTDYVHLDVFVAATIISLGAVWDALSNPIIGYFSDRSRSSHGRRRPFMQLALLPLALFTWLSFTDFGLGSPATIIYFIIVILGGYLSQALVDIPYSALSAELTEDYQERSALATCRNFFWLASMIISSYFLALVEYFSVTWGHGNERVGFSLASALCGLLSLLTLAMTLFSTRNSDAALSSSELPAQRFSFKALLLSPFNVKSFKYVVLIYALSIIAQVANNTFIVYFMKYSCNMDSLLISNFLVYSCLVGLLGSPVANLICRRSKRLAWTIMMGSWVFGMFLTFFFWTAETSLPVLAVIGLFIGAGLCVQYQLVWSMIPDCVDIHEYQSGTRQEALFFSTASMLQKLGAAATIIALGMVLNLINYDGSSEFQTAAVVADLRYLFVGCVSLPLLLSILINLFNPLTRKRHDALIEGLAARRKGKQPDEKEFAVLLNTTI